MGYRDDVSVSLPQEVPANAEASAPPATTDLILTTVMGVAIVVALAAHLALSRTLNVNWDEWSYLAKVHTWARGDPLSRLQTFHVHLFAPLLLDDAARPDREVVEVLRLRGTSFVLLCAAALAIVQLGRRLLGSVVAGTAAALSALTFSFVLGHGTAARYDPFIVTAFLIAAVLIVEGHHARGLRGVVLAGFAGGVLALGAVVSIKTALYVPSVAVLLGAGVVSADDRRRRRALLMALVVVLTAAVGWRVLLVLHAASLTPVPTTTATPTGLVSQLEAIGQTMFAAHDDGPRRNYLRFSQRYDGGFWLLGTLGLVLGVVVAAGRGPASLRARAARIGVVQAMACALPLAALLVYRNTFPYFFVTIIPPAAMLIGIVVVVVERGLGRRPRARFVAVMLLCAPGVLTGFRFYSHNHDDQIGPQRTVLAAVRAVFPSPVPYIDRCGMVASYPRIGPFMSSASMAAYRAKAEGPVWPKLLESAEPKFLLQNIDTLDLRDDRKNTGQYRWLAEDHRQLQESFIPHWGPLWVAGRRLEVGPESVAFEVHIHDRYIVEAREPLILDGVKVVPGEVVELAVGRHEVHAPVSSTVTLRTASAGAPPPNTPPERMFTAFRPRGIPTTGRRRRPAHDTDGEVSP
jgi:hypothetical protein